MLDDRVYGILDSTNVYLFIYTIVVIVDSFEPSYIIVGVGYKVDDNFIIDFRYDNFITNFRLSLG